MYKYLLASLLFILSCKSTNIVMDSQSDTKPPIGSTETPPSPEPEEETEFRVLDELTVTAPRGFTLPKYNPSATREFDLIHTSLELRFDWINEHVIGTADLTLKPYFYTQNELTLDAKNFEIMNVMSFDGKQLDYEYDNNRIRIDLGRAYTAEDSLFVTIDYIAKPSEGAVGGSQAISSDKGLFFINPRKEEANKPQQIWTQGETENNSRWFPTIDKPNENTTQDIRLTVRDRFKTLSNGRLVSSVNHADGTRTDHWKMDRPHAPYLFMLAIGEYAVVTEQWGDVEVSYYVEPKYEPYAKQIFNHTPEMLQFFSELLDYPYPWNKFSQVITRDYVSGAMENTTAVIYGEFVQKTDRELIDNDNDFIVAHEMFHHWFGDLVTCESWANLTLQEGMANYSEHLWQEYKYGPDNAGYQRMNEMSGYLGSVQQGGTHPLIHFGYDDKEDMFDGHSYNKGGLVLHMLRHELGDEAFFAALNKYLRDHAYTAVEADELRMAFEDVCGQDLNWFFDQWYFSEGHPMLDLSYSYDTTQGSLIISVVQIQDTDNHLPIYQLPVSVGVYDEKGDETIYDIWLDQREQEVVLQPGFVPSLVVFDRDDVLLYEKKEKKTLEQYSRQYRWAPAYRHRIEAIGKLGFELGGQETLALALDDPHFSIRAAAVENLRMKNDSPLAEKMGQLAIGDPHSAVRSAALRKLRNTTGFDMVPLLEKVFDNEMAYPVLSTALESLSRIDKEAALMRAKMLQDEPTNLLVGSVAAVFAASGDAQYLGFFEKQLTTVSLFQVFNFYDAYYRLLSEQEAVVILDKARELKRIGLDNSVNLFYRFVATNTINRLKNDLISVDNEVSRALGTMISEIKANETNEILLQRYQMF